MARPQRYYIEERLIPGEEFTLPSQQARQALTVMRSRPGNELVLFNGDGLEYPARVLTSNRSRVTVLLGDPHRATPTPPPDITLAMATIKSDRFDWTVQKATELGVSAIIPVETERSVITLPTGRIGPRIERWRRIAVEAAEQCGRGSIPRICDPMRFADLIDGISHPSVLLWEDERRSGLREAVPVGAEAITLLVGPEGGFAGGEIEGAIAAGIRPASLGPLILRSETAAIASIASVRALTSFREFQTS